MVKVIFDIMVLLVFMIFVADDIFLISHERVSRGRIFMLLLTSTGLIIHICNILIK